MLRQSEIIRYEYISEMPPTKIDGFFKQFPWVRAIIGNRPVKCVRVSMLEPDLFQCMPYQFECSHEQMYLLDENGEMVMKTVEEISYRKRFIFFGPVVKIQTTNICGGIVPRYQTLQQAMNALGEESNQVRYILSYFCFRRYSGSIILYKIPNNSTLRQWFNKEVDKEADSFQKDLDAIE